MNWLIGLPRQTFTSNTLSDGEVTFASVPDSEVIYYDATSSYKSLPHRIESFGVWQKSFVEYYLADETDVETEESFAHQFGKVKKIELNAALQFGNGFRYQRFGSYKRGVPQQVHLPSRTDGGTEISAFYDVDDNGWLTSKTDFNGNRTQYTYNNTGRLQSIYSPPETLEPEWEGTLITWTYDGGELSDQPQKTVQRCILGTTKDACNGDVKYTEKIIYDSLMRKTNVEKSDGENTFYQNFQYNIHNKITFKSYFSDSVTESLGEHYHYDELQRPKQNSVDSGGQVDFYYLASNKVRVVGPGIRTVSGESERHSTTTSFLAYGSPSYEKPTKIESPEGLITEIDMNIYDNILSIRQYSENVELSVDKTEYRAYDSQQRLCQVERSDVGTSVLSRNNIGDIVWSAEGQIALSHEYCNKDVNQEDKVYITYDNLGSQYQINYGDETPTRSYTYDKNGNVTSISDTYYHQSYTYNSMNLLEYESLSIDNKTFALDYVYDSLGHLKSLTYPDSLQPIDFYPNGFGQATQAIRSDDEGNLSEVFVKGGEDKATYHPNGIVDTFIYGNGVTHQTFLGEGKKPIQITDRRGDIDRVNLTYTYDKSNNIISITDALHDGDFSLSQLFYDGLNRLKETKGGKGIGSSIIAYDALGNIRSYSNNSLLNSHDLTYIYDDNTNRLIDVIGRGSAGYSFSAIDSYDSRGNVTNNGKRSFEYNAANQLTKSGTNVYVYDGFNRRIKTIDSNGVSYSMYSQSGKLLYREKSTGSINYVYLGNKLVAREGTGVHKASSAMSFKPYGASIEEPIDGIGYTGHKFDADLDLIYMQARYYDPVIGRFYSNDPVDAMGHVARGNPIHGFNRYAYANNNPYKYVDPDGKYPESLREWGNFASGIGKAAQAGFQVVAGIAACAVGSADLLVGSKVVGATLVVGGAYAIGDAKYTGMDAGNTIRNAWNNTSDSDQTVIPEGPIQDITANLGGSADLVKGAGAVDKVLGVLTGNVTSTAAKTLETGQGLKKLSDASKLAEKVEDLKEEN